MPGNCHQGALNDCPCQLIALAETGLAGTTLSFVDFAGELPFFCETVLPILQKAGLRQPSSTGC